MCKCGILKLKRGTVRIHDKTLACSTSYQKIISVSRKKSKVKVQFIVLIDIYEYQ